MKSIKTGYKIVFSVLFIICLFLLINFNKVNATTPTSYIWPVGGNNAGETYIEYKFYGNAYQEPYKDGKSGREYKVNNNLWPEEQPYYASCEGHFGVDITGTYGHKYNVVSVANGKVIATSAGYAGNQSTEYPDRNKRGTTAGLNDGGGYGNYVIIQEESTGRCFLYAHLKGGSIKVSNGDTVTAGQEIAVMGSSGDAGHMHLHFEIRKSKADTIIDYGNGLHRFQYTNSTTNLDPEDYIGSAPARVEIEKVTFIRYTNRRKINIYFSEPITVENIPVLAVKVGDEVKTATYIGTDYDDKRISYEINYSEFDVCTYGKMYVQCTGEVKSKSNGSISVDCNIGTKSIGDLPPCQIQDTYEIQLTSGKGDVNGDGYIDARDASLTLVLFCKMSTDQELTDKEKEQLKMADISGDGYVNSRDASLILSYYAGTSAGYKKEAGFRAIKCDFDKDYKVDIHDYELLKCAIDNGKYSEKYDLSGNGMLDYNDIQYFKNVMLESGKRL